MERLNPQSRRDAYGSRINRMPSPVLVLALPVISILLGSMIPLFFITSGAPYFPPLAFMLLMAWRILRPGIFPVWIGFPLGLFDDLFSGQPFGSAILLWSLAMIAIDLIEARFPWRSFVQDWLTVAGFLVLYILAAALLSGGEVSGPLLIALVPQIVFAIVLFPIVARLVARLDRLRLTRFRKIR